MSDTLVASIQLPAGDTLDTASWKRTPRVMRQLVVQLLTVIQPEFAVARYTEYLLDLTP